MRKEARLDTSYFFVVQDLRNKDMSVVEHSYPQGRLSGWVFPAIFLNIFLISGCGGWSMPVLGLLFLSRRRKRIRSLYFDD